MDELINMVAQKTGLAPDKARTAVDTVLGFLKNRLPAPMASQLDAALSGKATSVEDLTKGISGMMGS
ncbi:MAG TPA: hypothetical protein VFS74_07535 [Gemmatimonadales bacterium]|jgi:uncharacterized protein (DUF2267 family)|nr:hypothetical protein [Gemmatimonadales bacterium]